MKINISISGTSLPPELENFIGNLSAKSTTKLLVWLMKTPADQIQDSMIAKVQAVTKEHQDRQPLPSRKKTSTRGGDLGIISDAMNPTRKARK